MKKILIVVATGLCLSGVSTVSATAASSLVQDDAQREAARRERERMEEERERQREAERRERQEEELQRERERAARDAERMRQQARDQAGSNHAATSATLTGDPNSKEWRKYQKSLVKAREKLDKQLKKAREETNPWTMNEMIRRANGEYQKSVSAAELEYLARKDKQ